MPDGTWQREGPEEMMVSLDSARQWGVREQHIACHTDHSQIAKIRPGQSGAYPDIVGAIKQAVLSIGNLCSEAYGQQIIRPTIQESKSDTSTDQRGSLGRHSSAYWEGLPIVSSEGQKNGTLERVADQPDTVDQQEHSYGSHKPLQLRARRSQSDRIYKLRQHGLSYDKNADTYAEASLVLSPECNSSQCFQRTRFLG